MYENAIKRENTKKNNKNKIKQDEKSESKRGRSSHAGGRNQEENIRENI